MNIATLIIVGGIILLGIGVLVAVISLRRAGGDVTQSAYSSTMSTPPSSNIPAEKLAQVQALLNANRKIDAIKLVREITNLGLKEAKDYVEALERSPGQVPSITNVYAQQNPSQTKDPSYLDYDIRDLLAKNKKIEAVKLVREATGWGLKESKDYVENIQAQG